MQSPGEGPESWLQVSEKRGGRPEIQDPGSISTALLPGLGRRTVGPWDFFCPVSSSARMRTSMSESSGEGSVSEHPRGLEGCLPWSKHRGIACCLACCPHGPHCSCYRKTTGKRMEEAAPTRGQEMQRRGLVFFLMRLLPSRSPHPNMQEPGPRLLPGCRSQPHSDKGLAF